jgi:heptosyltransferase-2
MLSSSDRSPILLVCFRGVGDFVRCHSGVHLIAAQFPSNPIDVVTSAAAAPLGRFMPDVRNVLCHDQPHNKLHVSALLRMTRQLRNNRYGAAFIIPGSIKASLPPFMAGIPVRVGYPDDLRFGLVNRLPDRWRERYALRSIDRSLRITDVICRVCSTGLTPIPKSWPAPQLVVPSAVLGAWRASGQPPTIPGRTLALYPVGADGPRTWPVDRFAALARTWAGKGWSIWIVGGARERRNAALIRASVPAALDLTGTSLVEAVCQLSAATAVIAADGGLTHVAAALGTPTIAIHDSRSRILHGSINRNVVHLEPPIGSSSPGTDAVSLADVETALGVLLGQLEQV